MSQRKHRYVCITLHQDGKVWKSDIAVNGVSFEGRLPGSIVEQLIDAGGELLSTHYVEHYPSHADILTDAYQRRHVLWFRFPMEGSEESVQLELSLLAKELLS